MAWGRGTGSRAVFHFLPLHLAEYAQRWGGQPGACALTEDIIDRLVRLPFFTGMTEEIQSGVMGAIRSLGFG
jgi:dTDP-4-amino-4,6-dideoxygalactose transaminase